MNYRCPRDRSIHPIPLAFAAAVLLTLTSIGSTAQEQIATHPADPGAAGGFESDHAHHPTEVIAILGGRLTPAIQHVPQGSAFGWLNYTATDATIRFEEGIVDKLVCRSPGRFRVEARHLEAPQVPAGEFATLCSLRPGDYHYEVHLKDRAAPLLGKLVVAGGMMPKS